MDALDERERGDGGTGREGCGKEGLDSEERASGKPDRVYLRPERSGLFNKKLRVEHGSSQWRLITHARRGGSWGLRQHQESPGSNWLR